MTSERAIHSSGLTESVTPLRIVTILNCSGRPPRAGWKLISGMLTAPASWWYCHHCRGSTGSIERTSRSNSKFISRATTWPVESETVPLA